MRFQSNVAHHIYTTDAYVLDRTASGEADEFLTLFTRDLGLVRAAVRGVRLEKSKLRYALQDLSESRVSLVRGKEVWRVTTAVFKDSFHTRYRNQKPVLAVVGNCAALLRRLVAGEEKNEKLFNAVCEAFDFLASREWGSELALFEIMLVLKILHHLGYASSNTTLTPLVAEPWSFATLENLAPHRALAIREINTSLRESQL